MLVRRKRLEEPEKPILGAVGKGSLQDRNVHGIKCFPETEQDADRKGTRDLASKISTGDLSKGSLSLSRNSGA
jgi:hypothetical protein